MRIPLQVSKLDLSNMGLTTLPTDLFKCKNLRKLNLSNNYIKTIPAELSNLKKLRNLDLSYNEISTLYSKNFDFQKLEVLILRSNRIKKLPWQIGNLAKLKILNLSGNSLTNLPTEINKMNELAELNLANNLFTKFPDIILSVPTLKTIWLNNNQFMDFPILEIKKSLPLLESIYCFSHISNQDNVDKTYSLIKKYRGNALAQLNLLILKNKSKSNMKIDSPNTNNQNKIIGTLEKSLFISYCHADVEWLNKINIALQTMEYEGLKLNKWDDLQLNAGDEWKVGIQDAIENAGIAILLVSNNFLASKFIRTEEVPQLLKKAEENGARILPIIIGYCRFTKSVIGKYQAINNPEKPLNSLPLHEQDKVIYDLTNEIDKVLKY